MELVVIRHGETRANAEGRYLGALDLPLNYRGREQAVELALPIRIEPAFHERHVGLFEGLTQIEARERYPALWARNITRRWDEAPPGGESLDAVIARVSRGLTALVHRHGGERVLLVAKVIRALTGAGFADFFSWQLHNGGRLVVRLAPARPPAYCHRPVGQE